MRGTGVYELIERFGTPARVLEASLRELSDIPWMTPELARGIARRRREQKGVVAARRLSELGARAVPFTSSEYPASLGELSGMPPLLYVMGELLPEDSLGIALVGSRKSSPYGRLVAERLAADLARSGITVVSGLARGIDTAAHRAALDAGGRTIAVLGCGIDRIYPRENRALRERIRAQGAVVTEFPLGAPPLARHFPARNRIISGLSLGVVAVEARLRSGVMSTVRWALDQGREVFAVPGNIDSPGAEGTNRLIQQGAKLVLGVEDILEEFGLSRMGASAIVGAEGERAGAGSDSVRMDSDAVGTDSEPACAGSEPVGMGSGPGGTGSEPVLTEVEMRLLEQLSSTPKHIDSIVRETSVSVSEALTYLLALEMRGMVRQIAGKSFVRAM
ncbi:hypothetical protein AMJ39_02895 [candidate division TA06 bacterium DG_24]|uniref:Uncharacterized protein n=3 Tax=Bacteria division TA06 TaxID=1156500 RepID=A0A0S7WUK3_UNCT6|nr:MAG: hypothetical protein AMJ39_02895 [candidate division TA06 bacterium DG_24]